jgi:flagellar hook assembly protein FlgD
VKPDLDLTSRITTVIYELPKTSHVSLVVFNLLGQKVKTLMNRIAQAGTYKAHWDGMDEAGNSVAAGIYLVRMDAGRGVCERHDNAKIVQSA